MFILRIAISFSLSLSVSLSPPSITYMWVVDSTVIVMMYDGHHGVWHRQFILHVLKAGPVVIRYKQVTGGGARGVATAWQRNDDLWPRPRPVDDHLGVAVIQLNLEKKIQYTLNQLLFASGKYLRVSYKFCRHKCFLPVLKCLL